MVLVLHNSTISEFNHSLSTYCFCVIFPTTFRTYLYICPRWSACVYLPFWFLDFYVAIFTMYKWCLFFTFTNICPKCSRNNYTKRYVDSEWLNSEMVYGIYLKNCFYSSDKPPQTEIIKQNWIVTLIWAFVPSSHFYFKVWQI